MAVETSATRPPNAILLHMGDSSFVSKWASWGRVSRHSISSRAIDTEPNWKSPAGWSGPAPARACPQAPASRLAASHQIRFASGAQLVVEHGFCITNPASASMTLGVQRARCMPAKRAGRIEEDHAAERRIKRRCPTTQRPDTARERRRHGAPWQRMRALSERRQSELRSKNRTTGTPRAHSKEKTRAHPLRRKALSCWPSRPS